MHSGLRRRWWYALKIVLAGLLVVVPALARSQ
jgi:hypothetical protein